MAARQGAAETVNRPQTGNRTAHQGRSPIAPAWPTGGDISPADLVGGYAALLQAHKFDQAYGFLDPSIGLTKAQFEKSLSDYKTIHAAVGKSGPVEGAAGSLYSTVQLALSGEKLDGTPYFLTGPVTLRRVNDVPGSTQEQRKWHIYKLDLSSSPRTSRKPHEPKPRRQMMSRFDDIREHMQVIDAEGAPVGKVDGIEGDRIKLTRDSSSAGVGKHEAHHHFIPKGLVAEVEGDTVRLSARADALEAIFETEEGGESA